MQHRALCLHFSPRLRAEQQRRWLRWTSSTADQLPLLLLFRRILFWNLNFSIYVPVKRKTHISHGTLPTVSSPPRISLRFRWHCVFYHRLICQVIYLIHWIVLQCLFCLFCDSIKPKHFQSPLAELVTLWQWCASVHQDTALGVVTGAAEQTSEHMHPSVMLGVVSLVSSYSLNNYGHFHKQRWCLKYDW